MLYLYGPCLPNLIVPLYFSTLLLRDSVFCNAFFIFLSDTVRSHVPLTVQSARKTSPLRNYSEHHMILWLKAFWQMWGICVRLMVRTYVQFALVPSNVLLEWGELWTSVLTTRFASLICWYTDLSMTLPGKWLLVNIQREEEFNCHVANRDFWSDENIKEIINCGFLFWQVQAISLEGAEFCKK